MRIKARGEARSPRTPAQDAATNRNLRIFQLRGLAGNQRLLTGKRRERFVAIIDAELKAMGAKTITQHDAEISARWEKDEEIPF